MILSKEERITGFKGFNQDMTCRGFQYKIGEEYEELGEIKACNNGFHFCEYPLDILNHYAPSSEQGLNRFCKVEGYGNLSKDGKDSKVACSKIYISTEIGLKGIIDAGVKFIFKKVNWKDNKSTNTGNQSAATNTGYQSAASVEGKESIAIVTGCNSKAKGALGCWIVLTERGKWDGNTSPIKEVKAFKVDGKKVKPDTWYKLIEGKLVEADEGNGE